MSADNHQVPIEIRGLTKHFGSVRALDGLDLTVREGEVHGFLGPNGAGKSTTLRILLGLVKADGGSVRLLGGDPWTDAVDLHRHIAYVPGDVTLWPSLTGGETIDLLARMRGGIDNARRAELIERFGLDPTKKARTYSKGNRQKVSLISALSSHATLLLLDEPSSGLDPLMENVFQQCIGEARQRGVTVLLSSHILAETALERVRGVAKPPITVTDPPADVVIERDVEVPTRDGTLLRINVFRSAEGGARPVIASIHPYGKDALPRRRGNRWTFSPQYRMLRQPKPLTFSALTGWEAPDPAWWTAQGFVVVNADSRGCGRSDGTGDLLSHQEAEDTYDLVGWLADQAWSDGRVVMLGVSYLAISQYAVAALQPPALRAICPWEGFTDAYRDLAFPGGIRESGFTRLWSRGVRRRTRQTYDMEQMQEAHPLRDDFWRSRVPDLSAIKVPMLVCGSFSDNNLHSRGSIRAFTRSGCGHARLYTHRGGKWETFYSATALSEQLKFLRDALAGSSGSRSVRLEVREDRDTITAVREETQWPLAGTRWRPMYLAGPGLLATEPPPTAGSIRFQTRSRAAAFNWTIPEDIELTGPMAARLWVQLDGCDDANLFVGVEKWRDGQFVAFEGSYGWGRDRVTTGWQRVSLRELDPELSQPWEPVPACARPRPVTAGKVVAVDVALGPSATLFRAGEQLRLVVGGRWLSPRNPLTGQFPAAYPRPPRGRVTLHWGPRYDAHLLIPEVPG